jgi:predicted LPLAT superfamily acyltransferase
VKRADTSKGAQKAPGRERGWTSRSIGSRFQHGIFYALIRLGGRRAAYLLLYFVAAWYALFRPLVRKRCAPYLNRRFGARSGPGRLLDVYRISLSLGKALIDRAVVGILGPSAMEVALEGGDELKALVEEGKGLIVVMSHVGLWQAAMSALGHLETPVHMLMQREEGDVDRHYFEHAGIKCPYSVIDPAGFLGGAVEMVDVLNRGEVLCVMGDRVFGEDKNTLRTDFLGAQAPFPISAYTLAASTGAPIAVFFSWKTGPASYRLALAETIRVDSSVKRSRGVDGFRPFLPSLRRYVDALEGYARKYPYQFFNFFDMWR